MIFCMESKKREVLIQRLKLVADWLRHSSIKQRAGVSNIRGEMLIFFHSHDVILDVNL